MTAFQIFVNGIKSYFKKQEPSQHHQPITPNQYEILVLGTAIVEGIGEVDFAEKAMVYTGSAIVVHGKAHI